MADDEEFTSSEGLIVGIIALSAIMILVLTLLLSNSNFSINLAFTDWGWKEWTSVGIWALIAGSILIAIVLGSDEYGDDDVFEGGYGFPLTIAVLLIGLLLVNTSFFGLAVDESALIDIDGDGTGDLRYSELPDGYVDYGSPQPYGFGNYGPEDEGLLTDFQGAGVGCAVGAVVGGIVGAAFSFGFGAPATAAIGCGLLGAGGYAFSSADFDGDPTTGL